MSGRWAVAHARGLHLVLFEGKFQYSTADSLEIKRVQPGAVCVSPSHSQRSPQQEAVSASQRPPPHQATVCGPPDGMDSPVSAGVQVSARRFVAVQGSRRPSKGLPSSCIVHFAVCAWPLPSAPFVYNHSSLLYSTTRVVPYYQLV